MEQRLGSWETWSRGDGGEEFEVEMMEDRLEGEEREEVGTWRLGVEAWREVMEERL